MPIEPDSPLPDNRMVEIVRIDGDTPGPITRSVPDALRVGMLARIQRAYQIGTNGSAVLMYDVRVGSEPEGPRDPLPIYVKLYASDVNPLPDIDVAAPPPALAKAKAERLEIEAKEARQAGPRPWPVEQAKHPCFAQGTQNDRLSADIQKALAEGGIK